MDLVLSDVGYPHGKKCPVAHMKRNGCNSDAFLGKRFKQIRGKVQPGRGRRHRAVRFCIDRLVGFLIVDTGRAAAVSFDVGRQRHVADGFQDGIKIARKMKCHAVLPAVAFKYQCLDAPVKVYRHSLEHRVGCLYQTPANSVLSLVFSRIVQKQYFDLSARFLFSEKPTPYDAGVVHHQQISWKQQTRKVFKMPVLDPARFFFQNHQA